MIAESAVQRIHRFDDFIFDGKQRTLTKDGAPVRLGSRALSLLDMLLQRPGQVVGKRDIFSQVWPGVRVDDANLRVHVAALRRALGDDTANPKRLHTVPGLGYRFVVDEGPQPGPGSASDHAGMAAGDIIGRSQDIHDIAQRLARQRFVTITGPGGMGKTTVARALARTHATGEDGTAYILELAGLSEPELITPMLASLLNLQLATPSLAALVLALKHRRLLIVFDNCEHLIDGAATVAEALIAGTEVIQILATSREPLRAEGEWIYRLPSLAVPGTEIPSAAAALSYSAVALFIRRSMASDDRFVFTKDELPAVIQICRQLDGMPLALELAAARVVSFPVKELAALLDNRFEVLTRGRRSARPRHQTLRATMDWSYDLLSDVERIVLRRLAVFRGEFSLAAALRVVISNDVHRAAALDSLAGLVAKSLAVTGSRSGSVTYRLLETTRAYASEKLARVAETGLANQRFAEAVQEVVWEAETDWPLFDTPTWLDKYAWRLENLRAAIDWALSPQGDGQQAVALVVGSAPIWFALSLVSDYCVLIERALMHPTAGRMDRTLRLRLEVLHASALFSTKGPVPEVAVIAQRALTEARALGDTESEVRALYRLARETYARGEYAKAVDFTRQFGAAVERLGDPALRLIYNRMLSLGLHAIGDHRGAQDNAERVLSDATPVGRSMNKGLYEYDHQVAIRAHFARILWVRGFADRAALLAEEGVVRALETMTAAPLCSVLSNSACVIAFWSGDTAAQDRYVTLLETHAETILSDYWRAFAQAYRAAIDLRSETDPETRSVLLGRIRGGSINAFYVDTIATIGLTLSTEAGFSRADKGQAPWSAPETIRAYGAALLERDSEPALARAEALFDRARGMAAAQGALAWELRAAIDLAKLWAARGDGVRARMMLDEVYGRFTEGFETQDLRLASALLKTWRP
ncbi:winged helix-turn-helix domain-containing protein [Acidisoma cellulosilytica]|uniref:Winged helix-turn-helix domain-containing protein n=1 Tax=Acidisoma cellulosilyticum TaxID=2802395 RepID=A0A963Z4L1_9PROT|nr:winged helix-turn-helix domain-containing protein [Acidisoma cellulosilyticum]MCB8882682.1 winged helix-turn-helix domain-containing protein [Acidisoma cellulosilyticum]